MDILTWILIAVIVVLIAVIGFIYWQFNKLAGSTIDTVIKIINKSL